MLSERNQAKTNINTYYFNPFVENSRKCKIIYTDRKQKSGFLGMGHGRGVSERDRNKKLFKGMRKLHVAN